MCDATIEPNVEDDAEVPLTEWHAIDVTASRNPSAADELNHQEDAGQSTNYI